MDRRLVPLREIDQGDGDVPGVVIFLNLFSPSAYAMIGTGALLGMLDPLCVHGDTRLLFLPFCTGPR
jgi:hypothetical protein